MSYLKKIEYEIVPKESFSVVRNCSGCGMKVRYKNTKRFRVNANGNKLDVWLIYQCEKCKHTFNLTVYERQKPTAVSKEEYSRFLSNDEELAEEYGRNFSFFKKNRAEVDSENIVYQYMKRQETEDKNIGGQQILVTIQNLYGLKIRPEKQIAEVLGLSRSLVKKLMEREEIKAENISPQFISIYVNQSIVQFL